MNNNKKALISKAAFVLFLLFVSVWDISAENEPVKWLHNQKLQLLSLLSIFSTIIIGMLLLRLRALNRFKKIEEEDNRIKKRIHEIINTMPLFYMYEEMITDKNGVIIDTIYRDVNKAFADHIYSREDCLGKLGSELFPDSMTLFLSMSNEAKRTGQPVNFQYYYPGTNTYYDIVARPSEEGRFMEYFCMDSTHLHHTQERLKSLTKKMEVALEVSHISSWQWELDKHIVYCQKITSNSAGETRHKEITLTEDKLYSYFDDEERARVEKAIDELITGKKTKSKVEYKVTHYIKGQKCTDWVEVCATVSARDNNGKPTTLVGSRQVITRRKELEEELTTAKKKAEESNKLKSSFLANMSHEIRTPLNAIVGFSNLLVNTRHEDEQNEYVQIIESNSNQLLQLVGDILDLSKIEAGTMEFAYSNFDLNQLMRELESSLKPRIAPEQPVTLTCRPGMERCIINSERNRLTQLITNLMTNAIKFTDRGSIVLSYELQGDMLRFSVKDTGCGISKEQQPEVFKRFVKFDTFKQGTGLGLPICKSIVENLGGQIGLNSEIGQGSEFWFTIPYKPIDVIVKKKKNTQEASVSVPQGVNILVAEDNESNYKLIKAILSKKYNLFHAWNGHEAVELFKECNPQLILMDINMPVMDGYEATREIRKLSAHVPILALTAYAYASDEERILNSGMNSYMSKPINTQQLHTRINALLHLQTRSFNPTV